MTRVILLVFAAGLLGDAVQNLQELGWLPIGMHTLWDTGQFLSEDSTLGDILHTFLGYAESPTILQSLLYAAYLLITGSIFFWLTRKPNTGRPALSSSSSTTSSAEHRAQGRAERIKPEARPQDLAVALAARDVLARVD